MTCAQCGAETPGDATLCAACAASASATASPHTRTLAHRGLSATGPLRAGSRASLSFAPGQAFGDRYTVVEEVGAGGMGQVYKAIDRKLGKTVALKLIRPDTAAQQEALERFRRELTLAQDVTHPNVCRLHDLGEVDGLVYISMEFVEGQSLEDLIQSVGHLSPKQTVNLGRQICAGLQAIHDRGIVHRDLKPGNVMVDRSGHALVMDFGMAYATGQERLTGEGAVLGTLAYLAPEQARGRPPEPRSDLYAVGLVLYEMLTGRRPPGDGGSVPLALRDADERCPPPSRLAPEVPVALDAVVMRCLERDPGRRLPTAADLEQALAHAAAALSSGVSARLRLPMSSGRTWPLLLAVVLATAAALAGVFWLGSERRPPPTPARVVPVVAVLPLSNVGSNAADEYLGVGIADSLITHLAGLPSVMVVSRQATLEARRRVSGTRALARELGVTYLVDGGVQRADGLLRVTLTLVRPDDSVAWGRDFDGSLAEFFGLQRRMAEELSAALQVTLTRADRDRLARPPTTSLEAFAEYSRARALLERPDVPGNAARAIEGFRSAIAKDARFALAHAGLGEALWTRYEETRDPAWTAQALDAITEALRLEPEQPRTRFALALLYHGTGKTEAAIDELQRVIALQPGNDDAHRLLGDILGGLGRGEEALSELRRAVELRPNYWSNQSHLGFAFFQMGRYADAAAAYRRVIELQPDNPRGYQMLGAAHQAAGDNALALENYRRANAIRPDGRAWFNIGTLLYVQGRLTEAAAAFEEALRLEPTALKLLALGNTHTRLGQTGRARQRYEQAVELCENMLRVNRNDAQALSLLAWAEARLGRRQQALDHLAEALALSPSDRDVLYRKAIVHLLQAQPAEAMGALRASLDQGFSAALARQDPELADLRDRPEFKALVADRRP